MKTIKYLFQYLIIKLLFIIFRLIGYQRASNLGEFIGKKFGPFFRKKQTILNNLKLSKIGTNDLERFKIIDEMWGNYGRIFAEYPFIKEFRNSNTRNFIEVEGVNVLEKIKIEKKNVIFVSAHFNNFELMAMEIEKNGINLAAIYRPLNNKFLNHTMENIRKKYICKNQIKKGMSGSREILKFIKKGYSIALMIDQRVSEGISSNFFSRKAMTTTIPASLVKKFNIDIVPVYIERIKKHSFRIAFHNPINFKSEESVEKITNELNKIVEKMIIKNPEQWIWTHDRWK